MLKLRIPEIVLGALLAIAIFAMGMLFVSSLPSPQQQTTESSNNSTQNSTQNSAAHVAGPNSPDERIANYTWWLSAFTLALVVVSCFQGFFLIRSDKTARITANAADLNARAAVALELPIIRIKPAGLTNGVSQINGLRVELCSVHFVTFSNLGRSKAFPIELSYGFAMSLLPKIPWYGFSETFLPNTMFDPDPQTTPKKFLTEPKQLEMGEWGLICGGHIPFWFYCKLEYLDFMQSTHEAAFCWRWQNIGGGMAWKPDATPAYNRKT